MNRSCPCRYRVSPCSSHSRFVRAAWRLRQLADGVPLSSRSRRRSGRGSKGRAANVRVRFSEYPPNKPRHHAQSQKAGRREAFYALVAKADVVVRELSPPMEEPSSASTTTLRPSTSGICAASISVLDTRTLCAVVWFRSDRQCKVLADVRHGAPGAGAGARRHSDRGSIDRPLLRHRDPARSWTRGSGERVNGNYLAAGGAYCHYGVQRRVWLIDSGTAGRPAQPSNQHSNRVIRCVRWTVTLAVGASDFRRIFVCVVNWRFADRLEFASEELRSTIATR